MATLECDVLVVGAGVVGLALARELGERAFVVERHEKFGWESSSHNSEVIHAGIYYDGLPLKAHHCRTGRDLLYDYCESRRVPHRRCGKWIFAATDAEVPALEKIERNARANDVPIERRAPPPSLKAVAALWSPTTGIVDSHRFMKALEVDATANGAQIVYRHVVRDVQRTSRGFEVVIEGPDGLTTQLRTRAFVNAAGLGAARFCDGYAVRACRGRYFRLGSRWTGRHAELIYPVPDPRGGLGVHLTIDLAGQARLGPDVDWADPNATPDDPNHYRFPVGVELAALREDFLKAGRRILSDLRAEDLEPDYIGVRAKLFRGTEAVKDFVIERQTNEWHLLGVESPGLTAALSLARTVASEVR